MNTYKWRPNKSDYSYHEDTFISVSIYYSREIFKTVETVNWRYMEVFFSQLCYKKKVFANDSSRSFAALVALCFREWTCADRTPFQFKNWFNSNLTNISHALNVYLNFELHWIRAWQNNFLSLMLLICLFASHFFILMIWAITIKSCSNLNSIHLIVKSQF